MKDLYNKKDSLRLWIKALRKNPFMIGLLDGRANLKPIINQ